MEPYHLAHGAYTHFKLTRTGIQITAFLTLENDVQATVPQPRGFFAKSSIVVDLR